MQGKLCTKKGEGHYSFVPIKVVIAVSVQNVNMIPFALLRDMASYSLTAGYAHVGIRILLLESHDYQNKRMG